MLERSPLAGRPADCPAFARMKSCLLSTPKLPPYANGSQPNIMNFVQVAFISLHPHALSIPQLAKT